MKSKLNINEFRNRLKENSKIGSPKLKLSHLGASIIPEGISKTFYGIFDDSNFQLTMNSTISPTFYIIKGKYESVNQKLNVNFVIEPSNKIQLIWMKVFPFFSILIINLFLFFIVKKTSIQNILVSNLFLILLIVYAKWKTKRKKKIIEQKFIEIFELVI
jgi:hypothetical protein